MAMKTRCRNCATKIDYGNTYCSKCEEKVKKQRKQYTTERVKEADKYTKTATWQSLRKEIIIRDKGCCVLCLLRGKIEYRQLQVHHIVKRVDNLSLAYDRDNLVTLCRTCHEEVEKLSPEKQRELLKMKKPEDEGLSFLL